MSHDTLAAQKPESWIQRLTNPAKSFINTIPKPEASSNKTSGAKEKPNSKWSSGKKGDDNFLFSFGNFLNRELPSSARTNNFANTGTNPYQLDQITESKRNS